MARDEQQPMSDARPESQRGTPLSEGSLPLTPERAMRMQRTTQFVMSAVAATPDCPVLFVDVGEGFLSLAHVGDIDRLIQETQAPLLAEVERLRAREAALVVVVRAVAKGPLSYDGFGGYTCAHCEQEYMEHPDPDDDQPGAIEHTAECPVTQARALLAASDDGDDEAAERSGGDGA